MFDEIQIISEKNVKLILRELKKTTSKKITSSSSSTTKIRYLKN